MGKPFTFFFVLAVSTANATFFAVSEVRRSDAVVPW